MRPQRDSTTPLYFFRRRGFDSHRRHHRIRLNFFAYSPAFRRSVSRQIYSKHQTATSANAALGCANPTTHFLHTPSTYIPPVQHPIPAASQSNSELSIPGSPPIFIPTVQGAFWLQIPSLHVPKNTLHCLRRSWQTT